MKRFYFSIFGVMLMAALLILGCGRANDYGRSVDISKICSDSSCSTQVSTPWVSLSGIEDPLDLLRDTTRAEVFLEFTNRMVGSGTDPGQEVQLRTAQIDYVAANGQHVSLRNDLLEGNVAPGAKACIPLTLFWMEQGRYIQDNYDKFPELPFTLGCTIGVHYTTTGGRSGSVQGYVNIQVTR